MQWMPCSSNSIICRANNSCDAKQREYTKHHCSNDPMCFTQGKGLGKGQTEILYNRRENTRCCNHFETKSGVMTNDQLPWTLWWRNVSISRHTCHCLREFLAAWAARKRQWSTCDSAKPGLQESKQSSVWSQIINWLLYYHCVSIPRAQPTGNRNTKDTTNNYIVSECLLMLYMFTILVYNIGNPFFVGSKLRRFPEKPLTTAWWPFPPPGSLLLFCRYDHIRSLPSIFSPNVNSIW